MSVEAATYIAQLDPTNPPGGGPKSEGDDHLRLLKATLKATFPNIGAAAVSATTTELNGVVGLTSPVQAQLDGKAPLASPALTGLPTAPTAAGGIGSTQLATTAFVQAAVAAVNATTGLARSTNAAASFIVGAGQIVAATNTGAVAVTFPAAPTVGTGAGVHFENGRIDNTVDLGANGIKGPNGNVVTGVVTVDQVGPVLWFWYGDYWRAA